jgi:hypothetical protein
MRSISAPDVFLMMAVESTQIERVAHVIFRWDRYTASTLRLERPTEPGTIWATPTGDAARAGGAWRGKAAKKAANSRDQRRPGRRGTRGIPGSVA